MKKAFIAAVAAMSLIGGGALIATAQTIQQKKGGPVIRPPSPTKEFDIKTCTHDDKDTSVGRTAWLVGYIPRAYLRQHPDFEDRVKKAFAETASSMTADELLADPATTDISGGQVFFDKFNDEENAILYEAIMAPPSMGLPGSCKIEPLGRPSTKPQVPGRR